MQYELATLDLELYAVPRALPALEKYTRTAAGTLLGCWENEIGVIVGRLLLLRGFDDPSELAHERRALLLGGNPFGIGDLLRSFRVETYEPFPFLPTVEPGRYGSVYEIRTYQLKIGGLAPTMAGWKKAIPKRTAMYPLITTMFALDGIPRITHIWPFPDLNERFSIRQESIARGIWPPENGPESIAHATSTIAVPTAISPLR